MTHRERFRALMQFEPVDRVPRVEWAGYWDKTRARWHSEGLPQDLVKPEAIRAHFGLDPYWQMWIGPRKGSLPGAPRHGAGIIENEAGYERVLEHLYPPPEEAIDDAWAQCMANGQAKDDFVVWITLDGFFWYPRTLLGIEGHFRAFCEQPELLHRMNRDLTEYNLRVLDAFCTYCTPDFMSFGEDMSYVHGSMISKAQFDEFMAPYYRRLVPKLDDHGILAFVDTDGNMSDLVPWFEEVGINGFLPVERQAGCDPAELRARHPRMRMIGAFDKMVMNRGEPAMRAEFERLLPTMRTGGLIPSVDHQTPPGVSMDQYKVYVRLLTEYCAEAGVA